MIADQLKALWGQVDQKQITWEQYEKQKKASLEGYASQWRRALMMKGATDFGASAREELIRYLKLDGDDELEAWHQRVRAKMSGSWDSVDPADEKSVAKFYDGCELELYNLLTWHTLVEDDSPLSYVAALEFARESRIEDRGSRIEDRGSRIEDRDSKPGVRGDSPSSILHPPSSPARRYLDFGSGVGSGGILFARNGFDITLADVSSPLLHFARWRHEQRGLPVTCIDLKRESLPADRFDFITAMDVFEHLVDPVATAEQVCNSLAPGGILFGRFHVDPHDTHVTHIARDFGPMFVRMRELGMNPVWKDEWLWGHQAFQKATGHEREISHR